MQSTKTKVKISSATKVGIVFGLAGLTVFLSAFTIMISEGVRVRPTPRVDQVATKPVAVKIPVIDTLEFDEEYAIYTDVIKVSSGVYAIAYTGPGDDGYLKTVGVSGSGRIADEVISVLEFDSRRGSAPEIIHVSGNIYAIAYSGPDYDGFIKTVEIEPGGTINSPVISTLEYDPVDSRTNYIIHLTGNIYGVSYGDTEGDGLIKMFEINEDGVMSETVINEFEFDGALGADSRLLKVGNNVFAIVYRGKDQDGYLVTFKVDEEGQVVDDEVIDKFEFEEAQVSHARIVPVNGSIYAIVFRGGYHNQVFVKTVEISPSGLITKSIIGESPRLSSSSGGSTDLIRVKYNVFLVTLSAADEGGYLKTIEIAPNGEIGEQVIDQVKYDTRSVQPQLIKIANRVFAAVYAGEQLDGYIKTFAVGKDGHFSETQTSPGQAAPIPFSGR